MKIKPSNSAPGPSDATYHPPAFFAHKDRVARWSLLGLGLSGLVNLLALMVILHLAAQPPFFSSPDANGIEHTDPGRPFAQARKVQVNQAILATHALLERSQAGFDLPEYLESMFTRSALAAAMALQAEEAQEFHVKCLTQKVHISRIEALDTRPASVLVAVTGKLDRHGVFQQQPFSEPVPFTLRLTFQLNPDLIAARQHSLLVSDFQLTYENNN